ncbi:MAG: hypothetical protein GXO10_04470 [Crenarchaeota archaeon]|nr:hypothetical protein [Thermoproteota archaeon]
MRRRFILALMLTIATILILTLHVTYAQQSTATYYIEQIAVKMKNTTKIYTIYIPEQDVNYTVKICNINGNVTIELSNYSSYAISNIKFILITEKTEPGQAVEYYLRKIKLEVPRYVRCVEIRLRKSNIYDNIGTIVEGISQEFVLNNNKINITTSLFPSLMIFNRRIGKLLFYKVCIVSVAPINTTINPDEFTVMIYRKHEGTLYEECYKIYEKSFEISIEGTAIVNVTAYYLIKSNRVQTGYRKVIVELSENISKVCNNVEICNSTYCGLKVIGEEKGLIFLTINNIAVRAYYLDSIIDGKIVLYDDIVPLSRIILIDANGVPLMLSELGKNVKIVLQGPVTVTYSKHACAVEGYYTAMLKLGNITYNLGTVYVMPGAELRLPFKRLKVRVELGGLCTDGCRVIIYTCGREHNYYVTPRNSTFRIAYLEYCKQTPLPVAYYLRKRIELAYAYYGNILLVNACISKLVINVRDMLGFKINAMIYVDGELCTGSCIVPCGYHRVTIYAYGVNVTRKIYVDSRVKILNVRVQTLGYRSMIVIMFIIALIVTIVALAARPWRARGRENRRSIRRRYEDEDVIEIS